MFETLFSEFRIVGADGADAAAILIILIHKVSCIENKFLKQMVCLTGSEI